jgi:hypothetical protein
VPIAERAAMIEADPDIRLRRVAGGGHGPLKHSEEFWPEVLAFMGRHLGSQVKPRQENMPTARSYLSRTGTCGAMVLSSA